MRSEREFVYEFVEKRLKFNASTKLIEIYEQSALFNEFLFFPNTWNDENDGIIPAHKKNAHSWFAETSDKTTKIVMIEYENLCSHAYEWIILIRESAAYNF